MIKNIIATTCFVDIEESAILTEKFGHTVYGDMRRKFFTICETLGQRNGAKNKKNTGDGYMLTFEDIEAPLNFASQLQAFYQPQPNYAKHIIKIRVGLYLGVTEVENQDAFGSGVNRASRVESSTDVDSVWVNEDVVKSVSKIWGEPQTQKLFCDKGDVTVKKLEPIRMFVFDWQNYIRQHPDRGLSALVSKQLEVASVILFNLGLADISSQLPVIWPVVPRAGVNAIHCGQLAIMRLLAMLGSQINVLIADCGVTNNPSRDHSEAFKSQIGSFATKIGIRNIRYHFMSDMFVPRCANCDQFHRHFQKVISKLTLEKLVAANNKSYTESVKEAIKQAPTLDFLKPALTIASILHLSEQEGKKCIIIVGYDEQIQWEGAIDALPETRNQFGILFNPVLKMKEGAAQVHQTEQVPLYYSWEKIVEDMEKFDLINWLVKFPLFLSSFPDTSVVVNGVSIASTEWLNNGDIEKMLDKGALARQMFTDILTC